MSHDAIAPFHFEPTSRSALKHIKQKHICDAIEAPLWNEWLDPQRNFREQIDDLLETYTQKPMYVSYDQYDLDGQFLHYTRELVTFPGILLVLRSGDKRTWRVVTGFYPRGVSISNLRPNRRWRGAIRDRVGTYSRVLVHGQAQRIVTHPDPSDEFPSADPLGVRRNVCFCCPEAWGFGPEGWQMPARWPGA